MYPYDFILFLKTWFNDCYLRVLPKDYERFSLTKYYWKSKLNSSWEIWKKGKIIKTYHILFVFTSILIIDRLYLWIQYMIHMNKIIWDLNVIKWFRVLHTLVYSWSFVHWEVIYSYQMYSKEFSKYIGHIIYFLVWIVQKYKRWHSLIWY